MERELRQRGYLMQSGSLVYDGIARQNKVTNKGETDAVSVFVANDVQVGSATVALGVRYEDIDGSLSNYLTDTEKGNKQQEWMPSISVLYELNESVSLRVLLSLKRADNSSKRSHSASNFAAIASFITTLHY